MLQDVSEALSSSKVPSKLKILWIGSTASQEIKFILRDAFMAQSLENLSVHC